jgi:hypothetical protein
MPKRKMVVAFVVLLAFSLGAGLLRMSQNSQLSASMEEAQAKETHLMSAGYRSHPALGFHDYYSLIGSLVKSRDAQGLHLAKTQVATLLELDDLVRDAGAKSILVTADYLDGNPSDYLDYTRRNDARRIKRSSMPGKCLFWGC